MRQISVFAKHWTPGLAKTRLAAAIGSERACEVYRAGLETLLARLSSAAVEVRCLVVTPDDAVSAFQNLAPAGWEVVPQGDGDLGSRLAAHAAHAFSCGVSRLAILGADSPTLPLEHVDAAWQALDACPVALGPAEDGGYYLLGLSRPDLPIFDRIDWGTDRVLAQTLDHLRHAGVAWRLLPAWYDVDDATGLSRLRAELEKLPLDDATWARLRQAIAAF